MRDSLENKIPYIHFKDVSFSYPINKENLILKCNFSIKKPGFWMIVGKNGSGKSTLLKLINGIIKPQNGIVDSKANIGMVFQNPDHQILMPNCRSELLLNINQNISCYEITQRIEYVLDQVGLSGFEKRPVHTLSGGQKQRLTIACALISNRNFILLDEPTALLDQTSQLKVLKTIKNLTSDKKNPLSALWITHRYEELNYADAVAELKNGFLSSWQKPSNFHYN
ncbi:putative ABC transporter [Prochlorococcus marinus str. MIT 9302]|uniref:Putative ABC transporter n=1 Tax=Prochlorococcus marinus str. MIT 9302 TaxID=74545 RepID=A0A0A2ABE6_PROMR|nr:ABC transporter ATP-binding protein [Prochlorococcus marinus]KGF98900.1 putative ABC transporter [Prochlorococcus marinus str. MIT 9302]